MALADKTFGNRLCICINVYQKDALLFPLLGIFVLCFLSLPVFTERFHAKDGFLCIAYITFFFIIARGFCIYTIATRYMSGISSSPLMAVIPVHISVVDF